MEGGRDREPGSTLVTRTSKQHVTHNVTTTTKTIREVQYIGQDGQPIDFNPEDMANYQNYQAGLGLAGYPGPAGGYQAYNRPPTPPSPSNHSNSPLPATRNPGKS